MCSTYSIYDGSITRSVTLPSSTNRISITGRVPKYSNLLLAQGIPPDEKDTTSKQGRESAVWCGEVVKAPLSDKFPAELGVAVTR